MVPSLRGTNRSSRFSSGVLTMVGLERFTIPMGLSPRLRLGDRIHLRKSTRRSSREAASVDDAHSDPFALHSRRDDECSSTIFYENNVCDA